MNWANGLDRQPGIFSAPSFSKAMNSFVIIPKKEPQQEAIPFAQNVNLYL